MSWAVLKTPAAHLSPGDEFLPARSTAWGAGPAHRAMEAAGAPCPAWPCSPRCSLGPLEHGAVTRGEVCAAGTAVPTRGRGRRRRGSRLEKAAGPGGCPWWKLRAGGGDVNPLGWGPVLCRPRSSRLGWWWQEDLPGGGGVGAWFREGMGSNPSAPVKAVLLQRGHQSSTGSLGRGWGLWTHPGLAEEGVGHRPGGAGCDSPIQLAPCHSACHLVPQLLGSEKRPEH